MRFAPDAETQMKIVQGFNVMQQKEREEYRAAEMFKIEKDIKDYTLQRDKETDPIKRDILSAQLEAAKYDLEFRRETDPIKQSILKTEKLAKELEVKFYQETDKDKKLKLKAEINELNAKASKERELAGYYKAGGAHNNSNDAVKMRDAAGGEISINQKTGEAFRIVYDEKTGKPSLESMGYISSMSSNSNGKNSAIPAGGDNKQKAEQLPVDKNGKPEIGRAHI